MKKKLLLTTFLVITICLGILLSMKATTFASAQEYANPNGIAPNYYYNVNKSVELYDNAINSFEVKKVSRNGDVNTAYSDDFAGVYVDDNGILNIGVVGLNKVENDYDGQVIYRPQLFSYNHLLEIQDKIELIMEDCNISSIAVDEKDNKVTVYLAEENNISRIIDFLQTNALHAKEALNFIVDDSHKDMPTAKISVSLAK